LLSTLAAAAATAPCRAARLDDQFSEYISVGDHQAG